MATPELAVTYAALILQDDGIPITSENVTTLINAAQVKVEAYWIDLFVEYFKNNDLSSLLKNTGLGGGGGSAVAASSGGAPSGEAAAEPAKEQKKEEEAVVELAGGFDDLFG
jgi:large subunit ribosomal protein LP1